MAEPLVLELTRIFQNVTIHSPSSFSFAGQLVSNPEPAAQPFLGTSTPTNPLISQLQQQLYQHCFIQRFVGSSRSEWPTVVQEDNFLQALSDANQSRDRWDTGWQIYRVEPSGQVMAHKSGLLRVLWPGEFITHDGPGIAPREGAAISIHLTKESRVLQPGFYFAFGETLTEQQDDYSLMRFYWNIKADGISALMLHLTQDLNRFQIPFRFKCLSNRVQYIRLDAAVLYVTKRFFRIVVELLLDIHRRIQDYLDPETPLFTKRYHDGLALAEDPGPSESFGMNRCRIMAEAIWNAYLQGYQTEHARLDELKKHFGNYGLVFDHPYLNPGSIDQYELPNPRLEES